MSAPSPRPALLRIARLLDVAPGDLPDLDPVTDDDLGTLGDQVETLLYAESQQRFARIAGLAGSLPGPVAARLAERFLPPRMAARVAELLEPDRARDLVRRLSLDYLGSLALALHPVRSAPVVRAIPEDRVGEIARELYRRGEHDAMAGLATALTREALAAVVAGSDRQDLKRMLPSLRLDDQHRPGVVAALGAAGQDDLAALLP